MMPSIRRPRPAQSITVATLATLAVITALYWPVRHAGFVWDDGPCIHDPAWLRFGSEWTHYLFRDFCSWTNYFRPLGVALLTLEVRAFDAQPGPMHVVSLAIHLVNTLLVGLLASRIAAPSAHSRRKAILCVCSMLLFAIHPALVEPVVWIGCQFDLLATSFVLLAFVANGIEGTILRTAGVTTCFFLAACSKESALAFPPLLVVLDVAAAAGSTGAWTTCIGKVLRRQWPVYAAIALAVGLYLGFRHWALGSLVTPFGNDAFFSFAHFQEVCATYVAYLRLIAWPLGRLSPIHIQTLGTFVQPTPAFLANDLAAIAILGTGLYLAWRRELAGFLILAVTAALLPVMRLLPYAFGDSLYHERYAMNAIAVTFALLPALFIRRPLASMPKAVPQSRWIRTALQAMAAAWLLIAAVNVRATIPLWSNDVLLWQWALARNPDSIFAKDHLLAAYIGDNQLRAARALADSILASGERCPSCLLNAANIALAEHDAPRAEKALEKLKHDTIFAYDHDLLRLYILANGDLLELRGDLAGAEVAYREAIRMDPLDPTPQRSLAILLLRKGDPAQARAEMQRALTLFAPDVREWNRADFERRLATRQAPRR